MHMLAVMTNTTLLVMVPVHESDHRVDLECLRLLCSLHCSGTLDVGNTL